MAARLSGLKGQFILSLNDLPEVREIFGSFYIKGVETSYSVGSAAASRGTQRKEVFITNYRI